MRVIFTPGARAQLRAIHEYIARDDKFAARAVIARVEQVAALIGESPGMGRKLPRGRLRRFPVRPYPYLIFYEVAGQYVRIIRVRQTARRPVLHDPGQAFSMAGAVRILSEEERRGVERGLEDVRLRRFASQKDVAALFARCKR